MDEVSTSEAKGPAKSSPAKVDSKPRALVTRGEAVQIINTVAGYPATDAHTVYRAQDGSPRPVKQPDGEIRYKRAECEAFGKRLREAI